MPSCLLPCPLRVTRSLITFVCPWQTPVPRTHHTEPRSAFDIPLITRSGKAKTFTLWVGGGGGGGKRASILQKQHLQDELVSKKLPQPQMTELWIGRNFWPSWHPQPQDLFPFQSWSEMHTPSGRQTLQWMKTIWFRSSPFSMAYSSSCAHHGFNRHSVNSWKVTGSFSWSHIL